ncbi:ABC transporter permease [Metabacillus fastidiosus]|uniref:ABC transporter permease n=1 Tax=Metabacillus fastidiosus TaxID=1458 RepID=UPI003D2AECFF
MKSIFLSDLIKMKRSRFWEIVILLPLILLVGNTMLMLFNITEIQRDVTQGKSYSIWGAMWMVTYYCNFVMIHLSVTILTSFIANIEHQAKSWKLLFSIPISRVKFYWSRYLWAILGVTLSALFLMLGLWAIGIMFGGGETLNWSRLFHFTMFPYLSSFALVGFQLWLSMNIKNQAVSIITGGLGIVAGLSMLQLTDIPQYLPWVLPYQITFSDENIILNFANIMNTPEFQWQWVGISFILGLIIVFFGSLHFSNKEVN